MIYQLFIMSESIDYNTDLEQLLKTHAEECESLSILHRNSYEKYNGRSNYINIPVIILSSAIGFATGIDIGYANMNIILGVSSIFVGIIKSIDTYFQLGKRAESHRLCSLQFQQINKKIQIELALVRSQRVDAKDMMNIIKTDIKNLFDIAPLIDQDVIESFQKKYGHQVADTPGKYTFDAHTPNLCNGLSIVTVNSARNKQDYEERSSRKSSRDGSPSRDNGNNGNNGNNGITVVIDNAAIANDMHDHQHQPLQPYNLDQLNHQLQQFQQIQIQDINGFRTSADIVALQNAPSAPHSVRLDNSVPRSTAPNTPHDVRLDNSVPRSTAPNTPHDVRIDNSVPRNTAPNTPHDVRLSNSVPRSAAPSVRLSNSVPRSAAPSAPHSAAPSAPHSAAPSVHHSAAPSVHHSAAPSVHHSAAPSVHHSAAPSVHGDTTPNDSIIIDVQDVIVQDETPVLQLTQEQLQQLQQLQHMRLDLEGDDGMM
jgi:hypothetical protein